MRLRPEKSICIYAIFHISSTRPALASRFSFAGLNRFGRVGGGGGTAYGRTYIFVSAHVVFACVCDACIFYIPNVQHSRRQFCIAKVCVCVRWSKCSPPGLTCAKDASSEMRMRMRSIQHNADCTLYIHNSDMRLCAHACGRGWCSAFVMRCECICAQNVCCSAASTCCDLRRSFNLDSFMCARKMHFIKRFKLPFRVQIHYMYCIYLMQNAHIRILSRSLRRTSVVGVCVCVGANH